MKKLRKMNIKLAVFDVDGTLVTSGSRILLDSTVKAIHELQKQGIRVAIASGRPIYALEKSVIDRIHFDYFVCSNGSFVHDNTTRNTIFRYKITNEQIMRIVTLAEMTGSGFLLQFENEGRIYVGYDKLATMLSHSLGRLDFVVDHREDKTYHLIEPSYAMVAYIPKDKIARFRKQFPEFAFTSFQVDYYDVNPKGITKANGVSQIASDLSISMDQVISFGDHLNDKEMLELSGVGVAMGNAIEPIKNIADYVTDNTEKDGIRNALLKYQLIGE